ncbi:MAG: hypothetical protein AB8B69_06020 [Chitinophagales bacterium]
MKHLFLLVLFFMTTPVCFAQKGMSTEQMKNTCEYKPLNERVSVTVARFSSSVSGLNSKDINNFSTMLTNALQELDCYRVLSMQKDEGDLGGEAEGEQLKAQMVVVGEITEYSASKNNTNISVIKVGKNKVHMGFVLQLKDPTTRDIILSKSINVDAKSKGSTSFRIPNRHLPTTTSSSSLNPINSAMHNAFEQGVIYAVDFLIQNLDRIEQHVESVTTNFGGVTNVHIKDISLTSLYELMDLIETSDLVKNITNSSKDGVAILTIKHDENSQDIFNLFGRKYAGNISGIPSISDGKIEIDWKQ